MSFCALLRASEALTCIAVIPSCLHAKIALEVLPTPGGPESRTAFRKSAELSDL